MRVHVVVPGKLAIGAEPRGERGVATLRAAGIRAVLCVVRTADPAVVAAYGAAHCQIPLRDGTSAEQNGAVLLAVETVLGWLGDHRAPVYVHCRAGRNRSALVAALVARRLCGLTGAEALTYIQGCRPRALANPAFAAYLASLPRGGPPTYGELRQRELGLERQLALRLRGPGA